MPLLWEVPSARPCCGWYLLRVLRPCCGQQLLYTPAVGDSCIFAMGMGNGAMLLWVALLCTPAVGDAFDQLLLCAEPASTMLLATHLPVVLSS